MNLVEISALTKKGLAVLAALVIVYIFFLLAKEPVRLAWLAAFPPKDKPTLSFGLLDQLEFTQAQILESNPSYVLNTRTGGLPTNLPDKMKVYKYIQPSFSYAAGEKAQNDARILGFTDEMRTSSLSDPVFIWQDVGFGGQLAIDSRSGVLELNTPMGGKGTLYPSSKLSRTLSLDTTKAVLRSLGKFDDPLYTSDVDGFQEVVFGKFGPSGLIKADSTLEAQVAKVDFFRSISNVPILGPNPSQGMLQVVLREPASATLFPQLSYPMMKIYNWRIDTNSDATYPLVPVSTAWAEVSQNRGIIASVVPSGANPFVDSLPSKVDQVLINEIYVAYFDSASQQRFLQPVYVFEGNYTSQTGGSGNIFIYYPAVSGEYVRSPEGSGQTSQL